MSIHHFIIYFGKLFSSTLHVCLKGYRVFIELSFVKLDVWFKEATIHLGKVGSLIVWFLSAAH